MLKVALCLRVCLFVCLQAEANSPEQFVGIILREKISGSFINDVFGIYSGEVEELCLKFLSMCYMLRIMDFWLMLMVQSHYWPELHVFQICHILNFGELHTVV